MAEALSYPIVPTACPYCGKPITRSAPSKLEGHRAPQDGDVSLCFGCGRFALFEGETLRKASEEEMQEIAQDDEAVRAAVLWKLWKSRQ